MRAWGPEVLGEWGSRFRAGLLAISLLVGAACGPPLESLTAGGSGPPTLVLLHGFGSSAEEWMPFTDTIEWPGPGRFVFPQGPEPAARVGGRAWWPLDLAGAATGNRGAVDLSRSRPPGLEPAARAVAALLRRLARSPGGVVVLGGFSQGAMLASEVAFRSTTPLSALVLLSGTPVDEGSWRTGYASRHGLPVFIAHGRRDSVLPFDGSERMERALAEAGLRVTWVPFSGGHEIPADVVIALNRFLREEVLLVPGS